MARDFFRERRQVLELVLRTAERATEDGLKRLLDQTAEGQDRSTEQLREDLYARFASLDKREKQRKARAEEEVERQRQEKIRLQEVDAEVDRTVTRQPAVKRSNPFG